VSGAALIAAVAAETAPHETFEVWSPDQAVECLEGISEALYRKVWNEVVPLYDGKPRSEVPDDFAERSVAKFWDKFTEAERAELNAAAAAHDAQWGSL